MANRAKNRYQRPKTAGWLKQIPGISWTPKTLLADWRRRVHDGILETSALTTALIEAGWTFHPVQPWQLEILKTTIHPDSLREMRRLIPISETLAIPDTMLRTQTVAIPLQAYGFAGQYHASDPRRLLAGLGQLWGVMGRQASVNVRQEGPRNRDPGTVRQQLALYGYRSRSMSIRDMRDMDRRLRPIRIQWSIMATIGIDVDEKRIYLRGCGHDWAHGMLLRDVLRRHGVRFRVDG